jgi:hypothetical protein
VEGVVVAPGVEGIEEGATGVDAGVIVDSAGLSAGTETGFSIVAGLLSVGFSIEGMEAGDDIEGVVEAGTTGIEPGFAGLIDGIKGASGFAIGEIEGV